VIRARRALGAAACCVLLALGVSGCFDHEGTGVAAPQVSGTGFPNAGDGVTPQLGGGARSRPRVPLSVGDRWDYALHVRVRTDDPAAGDPQSLTFERQGRSEITSTSDLGSHSYALRTSVGMYPLIEGSFETAPLRVDEAGVFYHLPTLNDLRTPPSHPDASRADAEDEAAALRFPLVRGLRWQTTFPYAGVATVAGLDRVRTPAGVFVAWRVELEPRYGEPGSRHTYWYSDAGVVRESHRVVQRLPSGGQVVSDWVSELTALQLAPGDQP